MTTPTFPSSEVPSPAISLTNISLSFGGISALTDFSHDFVSGKIHGVIGPNGAGKTSLFNVITRLYSSNTGSIRILGKDVSRAKPWQILSYGLARTFQNLGIFRDLTILDNLLIGLDRVALKHNGKYKSLPSGDPHGLPQFLPQKLIQVIDLFQLRSILHQSPSVQTYGTLKRVELARAILTEAPILLLDEPAGGLTANEVEELSILIKQLYNIFDLTIIIIEHHMEFVARICETVTVMHLGRHLVTDSPEVVRANPQVIDIYIGNE